MAATNSSALAGRCALAFAVVDAADSIMTFDAACRSQIIKSASRLRTEMAVAAVRRGVLAKNMRTLCAPLHVKCDYARAETALNPSALDRWSSALCAAGPVGAGDSFRCRCGVRRR